MQPLRTLIALAALSGLGCAHHRSGPVQGPDPAVTDGDKYQVILENEHVRVLRYHDAPGDKTHLHHHPAFVIYALAPFERQLSFPDGRTVKTAFKAGDVAWMPAQSHVGENVGTNTTEGLLIELKYPP